MCVVFSFALLYLSSFRAMGVIPIGTMTKLLAADDLS
jgi:hypothetical protein